MNSETIKNILISDYPKDINPSSGNTWGAFLFKLGVDLTMKVRENRFAQQGMKILIKKDGSPATDFENSLESFAKNKLFEVNKNASFIGEELGTSGNSNGYTLVMDPIDGTRSFLDYFDTHAISLAIVKGNKCVASLVSSPSTADLYFRIGNEPSLLISLALSNGDPEVYQLPMRKNKEQPKPIILNIHPARKANNLINTAYKSWKADQIHLVKSISGSPSLNIARVALGREYYINLWTENSIDPFDLIAAIHILTGAGGIAIDEDYKEITALDHKGIFIAGFEKSILIKILKHLKKGNFEKN